MQEVYHKIKKDKQIIKFGMYGLLKNLKFFEPFLIIYLLSMDFSMFYIGILYSIREITNYIFEIPSGILADSYGKKSVLSLCFIFYIISFVFFFIGGQFYIFAIGMVFFGLGEAFRSGTHKAMIYTYLENNDWFLYKGFVYSRTRSYSLVGSAISSILSIVFILSFSNLRFLFLLCIVPYIADFILILTYPESINVRHKTTMGIVGFLHSCRTQFRDIVKNKPIIKTVLSSSIFEAIFKSIKDYIQPILQAMILSSAIILFNNLSADDNLRVILALVYGFIYLIGAYVTKNIYKITQIKTSAFVMNLYFDIMAVALILISIFIKTNIIYAIIILYFILYIVKDSREPLFVDVIGDFMHKSQRATVLSVESQMSAVFVVLFAPLFGLIADTFSIATLFLFIGIFSLLVNRFVSIKKDEKQPLIN